MYIQKIIHYDLNSKSQKIIELSEDITKQYIGGRGTGIYLYMKYIDYDVDAFDAENGLIFTIGPLVGTNYPTATRISLVSKSPMTRTISISNMGGRFAPALRKTGYSGIIITGKLEEFSYLYFDGKEFTVHQANELRGKLIIETEDILKQKHKKGEIMSIGPAGENLIKFAGITHNKENDFARGGLGAVMGSKNIKSIVIEPINRVKYEIHNKDKMRSHAKKLTAITRNSDLYEKYSCVGTNMFPAYYKKIDGLTVNNFTVNSSKDNSPQYDQLHGKNLNKFKVKSTACYGCVVACRHHYEIDGERILTPEFESVQLLGPHIGIFDPKVILPITEHVTNLGMDTISAGHIISSIAHLIKKNKIDYKVSKDKDRLIQIFDEIAYASTELSKEMADGALDFSTRYGEEQQVAHVKKLELSAYEPRAVTGQAIGYGISSRGGDHLRGGAVIAAEAMKTPVPIDNKVYSGKGKLVEFGAKTIAIIDCIGTCVHGFVSYIALHPSTKLLPNFVISKFSSLLPSVAFKFVSNKPIYQALETVTGIKFNNSDITKATQRILTLERLYNNHQGFKMADDFLPDKFYTENKLDNNPLDREKYTREMILYYKSLGWDKNGIPMDKTLEKLDLKQFIQN